ncbi:peroxiredoxin [Russula vinacea]|nr:peroxiredoxin [Russula vinacea]
MSPTIQSPAPAFTVTALVDGAFKQVSLSDYAGQWVILMFYPLDFTFVCPTEILAFDTALPTLHVQHTVLAAAPEGGLGPNLRIPLLADRSLRVARDYGCLIEEKGITFRASYLIDPKGVLRQFSVSDLPVGRSVDEALRLVQAFQFTDEHGRCKDIRADPTAKLEYFAAVDGGKLENGKANGTKRTRVE